MLPLEKRLSTVQDYFAKWGPLLSFSHLEAALSETRTHQLHMDINTNTQGSPNTQLPWISKICMSYKGRKKKIYGSWEDAFGHFSSSQWKGGGIDGRVGPRTGASERRVLAHCAGARRGCVPSGEVVGTSPCAVPARWQEGSRCVFLMASTRGRLLVLGGSPLHGSDAPDSRMGACLWGLSLGQRTGNGRSYGKAFWDGLWMVFL